MSRPPYNGSSDPAIAACPKMQAACKKANDKRAAEQAVADAATAAHPECSKRYRDAIASADERHRVRLIEASAARNSGARSDDKDRTAYSQAIAEVSEAYSRAVAAAQEENHATYRQAIADADKAYSRAVAESARIASSDRDRAYQEYRYSPGYLGQPAP